VETLHNIAGHAVTPPDPLPYDGYWYDENGVWTEITDNDRCIACHGAPPDPAPDTMLYVSQDVGTYDTIYEELLEADCRFCHGFSTADRHHQLLAPPTIDKIRGVKEPGGIIRIIGGYFEDTQEDSIVHLGSRTYDSSKRRIKLWSPTKIKIKLPNYPCSWFHRDVRRLKVWVTVNGKDSNVKKIRVQKSDICP
jgi:hypothetical protein